MNFNSRTMPIVFPLLAGLMTLSLGGCFALISGGGDSSTPEALKTKKVRALKTVAVVGVCSFDSMGQDLDGQLARVSVTSTAASLIASGFDAEFAKAFGIAPVTPLSQVKQVAAIPRGTPTERAICPDGIHPFQKRDGGVIGSERPNPDLVAMKAMAEALDVDAVVAVLVHPFLTVDDAGEPEASIALHSGTLNPSLLVVVSRSGEPLVVQDLEAEIELLDASAKPPETLHLGFGAVLAKESVKLLTSD